VFRGRGGGTAGWSRIGRGGGLGADGFGAGIRDAVGEGGGVLGGHEVEGFPDVGIRLRWPPRTLRHLAT
jgi:hypothetical protein